MTWENDMAGKRWTATTWVLVGLLLASAAGATPLINEFMSSNASAIADPDGDYSDWLELYNPGPAAYDLTGCWLSDSAGTPLRWQFPAAVIPAQGHLLVWASSKDRTDPGNVFHTNFAISAGGEPLLLTAADGVTLLDQSPSTPLGGDLSFGRQVDGGATWVVFAGGTPGADNGGALPYLAAPAFSHQPGYFTSAVSLGVTSADPNAQVTYTLDGSEPTESSPPVTGPIVLGSRVGQPNAHSLIPTNHQPGTDYYGWRPPRGEVFKVNVVRARAFRPGYAPSATVTGTFVVDPNPASRLPLPVVSLVTDPVHLFDDTTGIYVPGIHAVPGNAWSGNYFQAGDDWERPVHVELFDTGGQRLLGQDCGMRVHGNFTQSFPQKSLLLYARSEYGASHFNAALFPELPYDAYKRVIVRNTGNAWREQGFRDLAFQIMSAGLGFETQAGRPAVHFVNGEYWGLTNLRERYDEDYFIRCYGLPEEEVALLENNATVEEGPAAERDRFLALRNFIDTADMTLPASMDHVRGQMDVANFLAYMSAEIYSCNRDWPGNNVRFWRRSVAQVDTTAAPGWDGRWRWVMYDVDSGLKDPWHDALAQATATNGPSWPNPPWSTAMLRGLLENPGFRDAFINSVADNLNSRFSPQRGVAVIDSLAAIYAPAISAWQNRWDISYNWTNGVQWLRDFVNQRPDYLRQHVIDHFGLAGTTTVTLAVDDPAGGRIRINRLLVDGGLPGLPDPGEPYPWTGAYFQGVPVTVTAEPLPGHFFTGWQDGPAEAARVVTPGADPVSLVATFAPQGDLPVVVAAWDFNALPAGALAAVPADLAAHAGAAITYPGAGAGYLDRVDPGTTLGAPDGIAAGYALRARNPADSREISLAASSAGCRDLVLSYAAMRTANGAETHSVYCQVQVNGTLLPVALDVPVGETFQVFEHDLAAVAGTADNPHLMIHILFGGANSAGTSGNQRFDNLRITGLTYTPQNAPPQVVAAPGLLQAVEGATAPDLDLAQVFADPEGVPLAFGATCSDDDFATVSLSGSLLTVQPLRRGDVVITLTADDGVNPPVAHDFRLLVHPQAVAPGAAPYAFTEWDPNLPERSYPPHMLFLQSTVNDPGPAEPLLHPYFIAHDDYHENDQGTIGFPYNNTGRTRINGLGASGISFVNTGRGRDLGAAVLALDTRGLAQVDLSWLAGTVLPNTRVYAIRLQYRLGHEGDFQDVLIGGAPVEYVRNATAGHTAAFSGLQLPAALLGKPYLQLAWRYYLVSGSSGSRAELRLDDITVTGHATVSGVDDVPAAETALLGLAPNPFNPATTIRFSVGAGETAELEVYDGRGRRVRALGAFGPGLQSVTWHGEDEGGRRCASGVYFCRLRAAGRDWTAKMVLFK